jgi:hypothetical protein
MATSAWWKKGGSAIVTPFLVIAKRRVAGLPQ